MGDGLVNLGECGHESCGVIDTLDRIHTYIENFCDVQHALMLLIRLGISHRTLMKDARIATSGK